MDQRFLIPALATEAIGIAISSFIYQFALSATSLSSVAIDANIAMFVLAIAAGLSTILGGLGIVHRSGITRKTAAILGLASFALGVFALFACFGFGVGYGDDQMICGGFPPGYWTSANEINRCSIWVVTHEDWMSTIFIPIIVTSAAIFWASVITRVRVGASQRPST